jgi:hypothetical protein
MPTYSLDPLYPPYLRCDHCRRIIAVTDPVSAAGLEDLTAGQVRQYFGQVAGQAAELHDRRCWGQEGGP